MFSYSILHPNGLESTSIVLLHCMETLHEDDTIFVKSACLGHFNVMSTVTRIFSAMYLLFLLSSFCHCPHVKCKYKEDL